jgi:putative membrane protein
MKEEKKRGATNDHLANERTYLAWVRTSLGIMAFGFVVEKFALFMKQMSVFLENSTIGYSAPPTPEFSSIIGVSLVGFGTLMSLLAFIRYKNVKSQIDSDTFQPSSILNILLLMAVMVVGIVLVVYLIQSL